MHIRCAQLTPMENEASFKKYLINHLNKIEPDWFDGDSEKSTRKHKTDIVNHRLKVCIEIKDDTKYGIGSSTIDINKMNKHYSDDIKSANEKFGEYPKYRTLLLIRTYFPVADIISYALLGPGVYKKSATQLELIGRIRKYSNWIYKGVGAFFILNTRKYIPNPLAEQKRIIEEVEIKRLLGY